MDFHIYEIVVVLLFEGDIYQVSALVYELELGNSATAGWISTGITMDINKITPRSKIELAMGMLTALPYLSGFISPYYSMLIMKFWPDGGVHGQLVVGTVLEIVLFVLLIMYFKRKKSTKQ